MLNHIIFQTSKWSLYCGVECSSLNSGCSPHKQNERWYRLIVPSLDSLFRLFFKPKRLALNLRRLCTIYIHFQSFQEMVLPFLNIYIATAGFFGVVRYRSDLVRYACICALFFMYALRTAYHARICIQFKRFIGRAHVQQQNPTVLSKQYELPFLFLFLFISFSLSLGI